MGKSAKRKLFCGAPLIPVLVAIYSVSPNAGSVGNAQFDILNFRFGPNRAKQGLHARWPRPILTVSLVSHDTQFSGEEVI